MIQNYNSYNNNNKIHAHVETGIQVYKGAMGGVAVVKCVYILHVSLQD